MAPCASGSQALCFCDSCDQSLVSPVLILSSTVPGLLAVINQFNLPTGRSRLAENVQYRKSGGQYTTILLETRKKELRYSVFCTYPFNDHATCIKSAEMADDAGGWYVCLLQKARVIPGLRSHQTESCERCYTCDSPILPCIPTQRLLCRLRKFASLL